MSKEDKIKELFAEKLGAHEAPVNPELWNAIASQIGTATAVTSTGLSIVAKTIIGISAASVIGVGVYFFTCDDAQQAQEQESVQTPLIAEDSNVNEDLSEEALTKNESTGESVTVIENHADKRTVNSDADHKESVNPTHSEQPVKTSDKPSNPKVDPDFSPFTNQPTPNLIGQKPTTVNLQKETKKEEAVVKTVKGESTHTEVKPEDVKASFEITKLPNIYVLNASGYFSIGHKGEYSDFQLTIMDKQNNVIFRSDQPDFEWRGTDLSGNQIEAGNYIYIITAKDINGKAVNKYSPLTVINQ